MAEIVLNEKSMTDLGQRLSSLWDIHKNDRKAAEEKWLQNLRQFRGIYDPEILSKIPTDRSKAYPKLTRWKIIGTVARLMQMLFPQTEKNYGLSPSALPNLSVSQLQTVLNELVAKKAAAQGVTPAEVVCKDEEIEQAIYEFAKKKAERMELKLDDDLGEMEFVTLARRVVFSAVLYNIGILKGPMHLEYKVRTWQKDPQLGYKAIETTKLRPVFEFLPVWAYYPDMTATGIDKQDGYFERHIMLRSEVEELGTRPDFLKDQVDGWLAKNPNGNHTPEHWETALKQEKKSDRNTADDPAGRKYVVLRYYGDVTGEELAGAGVSIPEQDRKKTYKGDLWMIEKTVLKCKIAMAGGDIKQAHVFVFEDDDLSLLGNGLCDTLRDSQLSICESSRMALDEASVGGENLEVNVDLLAPGESTDIRSHRVWRREGEGAEAQTPAVRAITRQHRLPELINLVNMFMEYANQESGLPPQSVGDVSQGGSEALRTQRNASMFLGAASLPLRDTVRNYDRFTISAMGALVKWNMKFDANDSRDGDFEVIARGSTSLIAKEILSQSLDEFALTLTPEERLHLNTRKVLEARAKARDIPVAELFRPVEEAEAAIKSMQEAQAKTAQVNDQLVAAKVRQALADAAKKVSEAKATDTKAGVEAIQLLMEALSNGDGSNKSDEGGTASA